MRVLLLLAVLVATGCTPLPERSTEAFPPPAAAPRPEPSSPLGQRVAATALQFLGTPYRYGGDSPAGFDCSGLVWYSYRQLGHRVPRTTEGLQAGSRPVPASALRPGDLLFFRFNDRRKPTHVGIYLGQRRFVHAPSSGGRVSRARLDAPYWRERLVGAGRL